MTFLLFIHIILNFMHSVFYLIDIYSEPKEIVPPRQCTLHLCAVVHSLFSLHIFTFVLLIKIKIK